MKNAEESKKVQEVEIAKVVFIPTNSLSEWSDLPDPEFVFATEEAAECIRNDEVAEGVCATLYFRDKNNAGGALRVGFGEPMVFGEGTEKEYRCVCAPAYIVPMMKDKEGLYYITYDILIGKQRDEEPHRIWEELMNNRFTFKFPDIWVKNHKDFQVIDAVTGVVGSCGVAENLSQTGVHHCAFPEKEGEKK